MPEFICGFRFAGTVARCTGNAGAAPDIHYPKRGAGATVANARRNGRASAGIRAGYRARHGRITQ
jgi:hypothetical protein